MRSLTLSLYAVLLLGGCGEGVLEISEEGAAPDVAENESALSSCITNSYGWCYGTAWDTTARYAPNRPAAMRAINDLYAVFDRLVP